MFIQHILFHYSIFIYFPLDNAKSNVDGAPDGMLVNASLNRAVRMPEKTAAGGPPEQKRPLQIRRLENAILIARKTGKHSRLQQSAEERKANITELALDTAHRSVYLRSACVVVASLACVRLSCALFLSCFS